MAYGSDVVPDSQERALVAGAMTQNGKLRGYVFGRAVGQATRTGPGPPASLVMRARGARTASDSPSSCGTLPSGACAGS